MDFRKTPVIHQFGELSAELQAAVVEMTLCNMAQYAHRSAGGQAAFAAYKRESLQHHNSQFLILRDREFLYGFAQVMGGGHASLHILELQVAQAQQGCGIGSRLMQAITKHARDSDLADVTLVCSTANPGAMAFYTNRHHFVPMSEHTDTHYHGSQVDLVRAIASVETLL